jgi:hypothetical protein
VRCSSDESDTGGHGRGDDRHPRKLGLRFSTKAVVASR